MKRASSGRVHVYTMMRVRMRWHQSVRFHQLDLRAKLCLDFLSGNLQTQQLFCEPPTGIKISVFIYQSSDLVLRKNGHPLRKIQMDTNAKLWNFLRARS